ncbi:MAG: GAF domain-containing protein [Actinomycetota bacterium]|nr:GAF domain-containing protein [Actinomycetota bacterium]
MTSTVPGFDEWLNRMLEECARVVGEDVDSYVSQAVAAQMLADQSRAGSAAAEQLVDRLSACGVFGAGRMPSVTAAVADPERLRALHETGLMDSPFEDVYDRITRAAAAALDAPYALVTLVDLDRQFFKSAAGMTIESPEERETPLDRSVCQYAVAKGTSLILQDARTDPIFKNHPAVADGTVVAYLGIPLIDDQGNAVGTLCVFDVKPRLWTTGHIQVLADLASMATERMFGSAPDGSR